MIRSTDYKVNIEFAHLKNDFVKNSKIAMVRRNFKVIDIFLYTEKSRSRFGDDRVLRFFDDGIFECNCG